MSIAIRLSSGFNKSFDKNHLAIGSDASCDVVLAEKNGVQPLHAHLRKIGDRWLLESAGEWPCDLSDSTKATKQWVLVGGSANIGSGDRISISQATSSAPMQSPASGSSGAPTASIQHRISGTKPVALSSSIKTSPLKDATEDSHELAKSDNITARRIINAKTPTTVFVAIPLLILSGIGYVSYRSHQEGQKNVEKIREGTTLASQMHEQMEAESPKASRSAVATTTNDDLSVAVVASNAPSDQTKRLMSYFSNGTVPNESWSNEKSFAFDQPYNSGGHIFLLSDNAFAYCASDFNLRLCDLDTKAELAVVNELSAPSYAVRISRNAGCILWGTGLSPKDGATLLAWNYNDKKLQSQFQVQVPSEESPLTTEGTFSPDLAFVATASSENGTTPPAPVRVWKSDGSSVVHQTGGRGPIAFSPDGAMLAFGHVEESRGCVLWDYKTDKKIVLKRPDNDSKYEHIADLAFIPNTPLLAVISSSTRHLIEIWNFRTHHLVAVFEARTDSTRHDMADLVVSPDGTLLVTGGDKVRVWHLPSGGRTVTLGGTTKDVSSVTISPDGDRIGAATRDKKVFFWTKQPIGDGEFVFSPYPQQFAGDPVLSKVRGPNGEDIMVGGDGPNTDWYFHYFRDASGKKVLHGLSRVGLNGSGVQESRYEQGSLISRTRVDSKSGIDETYTRRDDGNYDRLQRRTLKSGTTFTLRGVVSITKAEDGELIKDIEESRVIADDSPLPYAHDDDDLPLPFRKHLLGFRRRTHWTQRRSLRSGHDRDDFSARRVQTDPEGLEGILDDIRRRAVRSRRGTYLAFTRPSRRRIQLLIVATPRRRQLVSRVGCRAGDGRVALLSIVLLLREGTEEDLCEGRTVAFGCRSDLACAA